jgi:glucose-1-phosphate thymidylyltransferase
MTNKAVILARGLGRRMRAENDAAGLNASQAEIAAQGIKTLMPIIGDKTLLDFIFERLSRAGFSEFCLVIGPEHHLIRDFCRRLNYKIAFAVQERPLGTADAVLAAASFPGDERFLVVNSDNLYPVSDLEKLRNLDQPGLIAFDKQSLIEKSNIDEDKINKFAVLDFDRDGILTGIVEKPGTTARDAFISMNAWLFSPKIFTACRSITPSPRGEYELADAVNYAITNLNERFRAVFSRAGVLDLSSRADVEKVREKLSQNE